MAANPGVDPRRLQIGQLICIPAAAPPTPPFSAPVARPTLYKGRYTVQVSSAYGTTVDALLRANPESIR